MENMSILLSYSDAARREAESNQDSLFNGADVENSDGIRFQACDDWTTMDRLKEEFDALGLYLSAHPLDSYADQLSKLRVVKHSALMGMLESGRAPHRLNLAGSVTNKQVRVSQRGNRFAFVQLTDQTGVFEVTMFSDVLAESMELLESEKPLLITVNLKVEENGPRLLAARAQYLDNAVAAWHGGLVLELQDEKPLTALKDALRADGPGKAEVKLQAVVNGNEVTIGVPGRFRLSGELRQQLRRMPGILNVQELE